MDTLSKLIGQRVRTAREEAGTSQAELSSRLAFNDRQTLSTIELGQRRVSADELVAFAKVLKKPVEFFTDLYVVAEKNAFSYRARQATAVEIRDFEAQAEKLISAYRRFSTLLGEVPTPVQLQIASLTKGMPLDFAAFQGDRVAKAHHMGERPAYKLREVLEKQLGILVLYVDAPPTISGAACRLEDGSFVLINRNEPANRQNFDLAHELFHLLTWDRMPPGKIDTIPAEGKSSRDKVEMLADSFTAGLLLPEESLQSRWDSRKGRPLLEWLDEQARDFRVSAAALYWRLVNLRILGKDTVPAKQLIGLGKLSDEDRPHLYSAEFVKRLHKVLDRGLVSAMKAAELIDCDLDELESLFAVYRLRIPFSL